MDALPHHPAKMSSKKSRKRTLKQVEEDEWAHAYAKINNHSASANMSTDLYFRMQHTGPVKQEHRAAAPKKKHEIGEKVFCHCSSVMQYVVITDSVATLPDGVAVYEVMYFEYDVMRGLVMSSELDDGCVGMVTDEDDLDMPMPSDWETIRQTGELRDNSDGEQ